MYFPYTTLGLVMASVFIPSTIARAVGPTSESLLLPRIDANGMTFGSLDNCVTSCGGTCQETTRDKQWTCFEGDSLYSTSGPPTPDNTVTGGDNPSD